MTSAPTATVEVQSWPADYPPYTVGGSIYAVPAGHRIVAARALVAQQCRVHADVILDGTGQHRGVTLAELGEVRRLVPAARIDLHLIALAGSDRAEVQAQVRAQEEQVLDAAAGLGAVAVTLAPAQIDRHRDRLPALRGAGVQVWVQVSPTMNRTGDLAPADGALVMFIEPGTKDSADLRHLSTVAELSSAGPVAVDGGITRSIAARCRDQGASYLISGRDLLSTSAQSAGPSDPTANQEGAQP